MKELLDYKEITLTFTPYNYQGSIHDSAAYAVYDLIEDEKEVRDFFGIEKPNRIITEGTNTESWRNTDWAITGSEHDGKLIIGQSISCYGKEEISNTGYPRERIQVREFENRLYHVSKVYDRLKGLFTLAVSNEEENVKQMEKKVREDVTTKRYAEVDITVKKLDKSKEPNWDSLFSLLESGKPPASD